MKISVAMCTYNGEKYIKEQLDSILNQTRKIDEIIICDDKSTDKTQSIIEDYALNNKNIKYYVNQDNLGVRENFYECLKKCTGDIIFLSDQDDIWENNKVDIMVEYLNEHENINVVATNASLIDRNGEYLPYDLWKYYNYKFEPNNEKTNFKIILLHSIAIGAAMALRKDFVDKYLYHFDSFYHDHWYTIFASATNSLYMMDEKLIKYRLHDNNVVGIKVKKKKNSLISKIVFSRRELKMRRKAYQRSLYICNFLKEKGIKDANNLIFDKRLQFYEIRANISNYSFREIRKKLLMFYHEGYYGLFTKSNSKKNYYFDLWQYLRTRNCK